MTIRSSLPALVPRLALAAVPGAGDATPPDAAPPQVPRVTCRFEADRPSGRVPDRRFHVGGTTRRPRYVVQFDSHAGGACLERHGGPWPETIEIRVVGHRDTIET